MKLGSFLWMAAASLACRAAAAAALPADIGAGTLWLEAGDGPLAAAPALGTDVHIVVSGIVARVSVSQQFRNDGADWVEAVYTFPLPDDAAVDRLSIHVGDRVIEGEIRERREALAIYRKARDTGRRAGVVTESRPNLFTTRVANIAPGERVDVDIEYLETARYDGGEFSLRFPMTATPRYAPARPSVPDPAAAAAEVPPVAVDAAAVNAAAIHAAVDAGVPLTEIRSLYQPIRTTRRGTRYEIETTEAAVPMNRDFVLAWRPDVGSQPTVTALTESRIDATYALLMILPPADLDAYRAEPRELVFVVDTSGSMGGPSIGQAKRALAAALGRLRGTDRFNVFQFNSSTSSLYRAPVPLTPTTYGEALRYVDGLRAEGGTEMAPAITAALEQPTTAGYLRQVVFLTDGGVTNEAELFALIKRKLGDARLFTVGIGAAPNSYFMRKAARFGRGTYTHVGTGAETEAAMTALFDKLERVALNDVAVDWPEAAELYPEAVPDLYAGEPVVVVACLEGPLVKPISVRVVGRLGGVPWSTSVSVAAGESPGIASLWARRKIEYLLDSRVDGYAESFIRPLVVHVALEHHLVSPYTSLVAVDETPARSAGPPLGRAGVPEMPPAGAVYGGFPQTATAAPLYRVLGLVLVLAAACLGLGLRRARAAA